jgi:hypothetical protein
MVRGDGTCESDSEAVNDLRPSRQAFHQWAVPGSNPGTFCL